VATGNKGNALAAGANSQNKSMKYEKLLVQLTGQLLSVNKMKQLKGGEWTYSTQAIRWDGWVCLQPEDYYDGCFLSSAYCYENCRGTCTYQNNCLPYT
jgi:hypothetical protein